VNRNLLTDVPGLKVGNAADATLASGVTAILFDEPAVASADVRGGAPGTRDIDLLQPDETVERIDAVVLSGGSAFGLDAPSGVQAWLREQGRGFAIGPVVVPIVPGAIVFDLLNGGNKDWGRFPPYRDLGYAAACAAEGDFALGSVGAGLGATTANFKGGLGSASAQTGGGVTVGALAGAAKHDWLRGLGADRTTRLQKLRPRPALDVLHDDVVAVTVDTGVVHLDDVRVDQLRDRERLAPKAGHELVVVGQVLGEDLDGDGALEHPVGRLVDARHAARPQPVGQLIAA